MAWHRKATWCLVIGSVCLVFALVHFSELAESSTSDDSNSRCEFTSIMQVGLEVETADNRRAPLPQATQPKVAISDVGAFNLQQISQLEGQVAEALPQQLLARFQNLPGVSWLSTNSTSVARLSQTVGLDHLMGQARTTSSLSLPSSVVLVCVLTLMIVCLVSCLLVKESRTTPGSSRFLPTQQQILAGQDLMPPGSNRRSAAPHMQHVPGTQSFIPSQKQVLAGRDSMMMTPSLRPSFPAADKLSFGLPPTNGCLSQHGRQSVPSFPMPSPVPNLPTPSPRQLTRMPLSQAGLQNRVQICDANPSWSLYEPLFNIQAEDLYKVVDGDSTGNFDISCEGKSIIAASVLPWGAAPRALLICSAARRGEPLASCAPSMTSYGGAAVEICSKLEIRSKDNTLWGTLSPQGSDSYTVMSAHRRVLSLFGDQDTGRLLVKIPTDEVVAHAARDAAGQVLELGMRPEIDPILMIVCILSIVVFNPEENYGNIHG